MTIMDMKFFLNQPSCRNQEWVCLSIITPETVKIQKHTQLKLEVSMLPKMKLEIDAKVTEIDPHFNIYIAQVSILQMILKSR